MNSLKLQLRQLVKLMRDAKLDYALLGGLAVTIYGEPRLTWDIDANIILDTDKMGSFLKKAKKYGFLPLPRDIQKFVRTTGVIPMHFSKQGYIGRCDFILAQNPLEYSGIKRAFPKKLYATTVRVVTPEDLIIHKIISERARDREDVLGILLRQRGKLDLGYITFWLKKISKANKKPALLSRFKKLVSSLA